MDILGLNILKLFGFLSDRLSMAQIIIFFWEIKIKKKKKRFEGKKKEESMEIWSCLWLFGGCEK